MDGCREQRRRGTTGTVGLAEQECDKGYSKRERVEVEGKEIEEWGKEKGITASKELERGGTWEGSAGEVWGNLWEY